ncbi:hypothetical protein FGO68_gene3420 [Halteria grandinella]|uniref:Cadherin domain-containing protein n=1 Tax=Halteria grandinella TaxID=5974 RepID=A0A8J8P3Y7_HALGN|nr:hypothetical protein FGO68_gene3420 [Halteria grandinella]
MIDKRALKKRYSGKSYWEQISISSHLVALLIFLEFFKLSQQGCPVQMPFPKIVGGSLADTEFQQLDYNSITGCLIGVGYTKDQSLAPGDGQGVSERPIIMAYQGGDYVFSWGKVFSNIPFLLPDRFVQVKINRMGTRVVVVNQQSSMLFIVLDITDGTIISATSKSDTNLQSAYEHNLLLLDNGKIIFGKGDKFYNINPASLANSFSYQATSSSIIGLQTNEGQKLLQVFSFNTGTSKCVFKLAEFPFFWIVFQKEVQCYGTILSEVAANFAFDIVEVSTTQDYIIFQQGNTYFRLSNDYGMNTFTGSMIFDTLNSNSFIARGLYCVDENKFYSLLQGISSTFTGKMWVATVQYAFAEIVYDRFLPTLGGSMMHGYIFGSNKFFLISKSDTVQITSTSQFTLHAGVQQGIIYSPLLTCQALETQNGGFGILTQDFYSFTIPAGTIIESMLTGLIDFTTTLGFPYDIEDQQFEGFYANQCGQAAPNNYQTLSSAQPPQSFSVIIGQASKTFAITSFTAVVIAAAPAPVYTYSLGGYNGPANTAAVNPLTGAITISSTSSLSIGDVQVIVKGTLQDCQSITAIFLISAFANFPPIFDIAGTALSQITVQQGTLSDLPLPLIFDPDTGQTITASIIDSAGTAYHVFVDFTISTTIRAEPTLLTAIGNYDIVVQLNDGIDSTDYTLHIVVTLAPTPPPTVIPSNSIIAQLSNIGQPQFTESLKPISLKSGQQLTYQFPSIIDPDDDQFSIQVNLREAITFTSFEKTSNTLNFNPTKNLQMQTYEIEVLLRDNNINSKFSTTIIQVTIEKSENQLPQNEGNSAETVEQIVEEEKDDSKMVKCFLKPIRISKVGLLQVKIISSDREAANQITNHLNETHLKLRVINRQGVMVTAKINEILEGNILSIQLKFDNIGNSDQSFMDLDLLEVRISRTLMVNKTTREKKIAVLPKDTFSMIQVPKQSSAEIIKTLHLVSKTTQSTATAAFSLFFLLTPHVIF